MKDEQKITISIALRVSIELYEKYRKDAEEMTDIKMRDKMLEYWDERILSMQNVLDDIFK